MGVRPNVLLITLDQFRGDCLSSAGHPVVRTPHLDRLAAEGVRFARHYSQASPCGPGRASLYTGMYQFNHRVVANGTPLDHRFDNVALAGRRAGYAPALFGYTDQSVDPRDTTGPDDPRLSFYEGVLPGFDCVLDLPEHNQPWVDWLAELGYDISPGSIPLLATEHERPEEHSIGAFLTDRAVDWIAARTSPGSRTSAISARTRPTRRRASGRTPTTRPTSASRSRPIPAVAFHEHLLMIRGRGAHRPRRTRPPARPVLRDDQPRRQSARPAVGRARATGRWDDTLIVVTADHGEMLGDHGLQQKLGYWEESYAIPCIVRDPSRPDDARHGRRALHRERRRDADDLRRDRPARAGPVRRLPAHPVPRRRAAAMVADSRPLGVRLARRT